MSKTSEGAQSERLGVEKAARLRLALTAQSGELFELVQDQDIDILKALLKNPHLNEEHLLALLKRRNLSEQVVKSIMKSPQVAKSQRLKLSVAAHPATPAPALGSILPQLFLFELVNLMQLPGVNEDQKLAAERAILKRLPETELGNKITLARRGSATILEALLKEGKPPLVDAVLANSKVKEAGVLAFLNGPTATAETISQVARHPHWGARPNLRFAMLRNRKTPRIWFTLFLPALSTSDVRALAGSRTLTEQQLAEVREELSKRGWTLGSG